MADPWPGYGLGLRAGIRHHFPVWRYIFFRRTPVVGTVQAQPAWTAGQDGRP